MSRELLEVINAKKANKARSIINNPGDYKLSDLRDLCQLNLLEETIDETTRRNKKDETG